MNIHQKLALGTVLLASSFDINTSVYSTNRLVYKNVHERAKLKAQAQAKTKKHLKRKNGK